MPSGRLTQKWHNRLRRVIGQQKRVTQVLQTDVDNLGGGGSVVVELKDIPIGPGITTDTTTTVDNYAQGTIVCFHALTNAGGTLYVEGPHLSGGTTYSYLVLDAIGDVAWCYADADASPAKFIVLDQTGCAFI